MFEEKVASNEIWDAHALIKNLYNRNVENLEVFQRYFEFTCMIASWDIELDTRCYFLEEASTALTIFTENTSIDAERLSAIKGYRERLDTIHTGVSVVRNALVQKQAKESHSRNHAVLKELAVLKGKLSRAATQEMFDEILLSLADKESQLIKEEFSSDQKSLYDLMTKEYSILISDKMTKLAMASNVEYNRNAIKEFKHVLDAFQKDESLYTKSQSQLYALVSSRLFSFDPARLFNETLIYYNHVYSYIFSKLDEDGKFRLTQISIDTEKLAR